MVDERDALVLKFRQLAETFYSLSEAACNTRTEYQRAEIHVSHELSDGVCRFPVRACPECGSPATLTTSSPRAKKGFPRIRHHRCRECGATFKSVQRNDWHPRTIYGPPIPKPVFGRRQEMVLEETKKQAGQLIAASFHKGYLQLEGLAEAVAYAEGPTPELNRRQAVLNACPSNLFLEVVGGTTIFVTTDVRGKVVSVSGFRGGLLENVYPQAFPPVPFGLSLEGKAVEESFLCERWALGCRLLAQIADKADTKPDTEKKSAPKIPESGDVLKFCRMVQVAKEKGPLQHGQLIEIARVIAAGDETKAKNIARRARDYRHLWEKPGPER